MSTAEIKTSLGVISISEQVLAIIARDTALQINEVMSMDDRYSHGISSVIGDGDAEGVRVSIRNKNVIIDLYICVKHGMRIPAVALQLQETVKEDIFQYTGITVAEVNVKCAADCFWCSKVSDMVEDLHSVVSDEELYLKIEETILVIPEVKGFTSEGLQNIVKGITSAFGKKVHKGILIRHDKNGMTINIFISLIYGCHVHEVGYLVQKQVQREILLLTDEPVLSVDVAVTEVIK